MQLCITLEHRFLQTPDGTIWTLTQCPYAFFKQYLEEFDSVRVISRVFPVDAVGKDFLEVEGPGVEFYAMPGYKGPYGYLMNKRAVAERARNAVPQGAAVILRAHSQIANEVAKALEERGYPFAIDVVADPWDVLSPAATRHPVAPIARRYFTRKLKRQCQQALAVAYVTKTYLQQRYPPQSINVIPQETRRPGDLRQRAIGVSDVGLEADAFITLPRLRQHDPTVLSVIFVGTLETLYKGPDVLVDAIAQCKARGLVIRAKFIGSGRQIQALRERSALLGVHGVIEFAGSVRTGDGVRNELDLADVFVLPSRAEGVPRAMLEAMARGLPCLGTNVGGIPELLDDEDMVPQNDAAALALQLIDLATNPSRYARMAERNLRKASTYSQAMLAGPRRMFYKAVRDLTLEHLGVSPGAPESEQPRRQLVVAHVVEGCQGGVGTAVCHLIQAQANDVNIAGIHLFADPVRMGDMLHDAPAVMHSYKSSRSPLHLRNVALELQAQLAAIGPDIVYLHSTFPGVYGRLNVSTTARAWTTLYCAHGWAFTQQVSALKRAAYLTIERRLAGRADAIISISHHEHQAAISGGLRHTLHAVILHGVPEAKSELAPALTPERKHINLLFVGRFDRQKGIDLLFDIWKDPRLKSVHLWLIGRTTLGSDASVPNLPNIHALGWIPNGEIDRYIISFDAVIMPSRWEGFGLVALEGMRNARPVIASRTGGLQELIIDGANGRLFDPDQREDLITMLAGLNHEELRRMGEVAGAVFRAGFNWNSCYQRWKSLGTAAMSARLALVPASSQKTSPGLIRNAALPQLVYPALQPSKEKP